MIYSHLEYYTDQNVHWFFTCMLFLLLIAETDNEFRREIPELTTNYEFFFILNYSSIHYILFNGIFF